MLVRLLQVTSMYIHLILLMLTLLRQLVVVDMLELQQQSSKTTRDHYLLLVLSLIEHLKFRQVQALFHTHIKVVVMHLSSLRT